MALQRIRLGVTGIEVSELCYGSLILGTLQANLPVDEGARTVRQAVERGINFFDTAKTYGTYPHLVMGLEGVKDVVIASKSPVSDPRVMQQDIDDCLRTFDRETIDIFHLHLIRSASDMREREDALHVLVRNREAGKIRAVGISTHGVAGTRCALDYPEIEVVFPLVNMKGLGLSDGSLDEMLATVRAIRESGRGLYAMKPLAGGHLIDEIPGAIGYLRGLGLFDSITVGLKTPEEVDIMAGVFEGDPSAIEQARAVADNKTAKKRLIAYEFLCKQCWSCVDACAQGALSPGDAIPEIDHEKCILCGYCAVACPKFAIRVI